MHGVQAAIDLKYTKREKGKNQIKPAAMSALIEWFTLVKSRPFIPTSPWQLDLSCVPVNKGANTRLSWTKYIDLYGIVHPNLLAMTPNQTRHP